MDSKTIFIRTGTGEDEIRSKTGRLDGDIKRALLMVDGTATFGEISKRAAPSLRSMLDELFKELEKGGFIQDKAKVGNIPRMAVPPKMSVPLKKPADQGSSELDFTSAFRAPTAEMMVAEAVKAQADKLKAEAESKARAEAEMKARQENEAAKLKAQQEAETARHKAEQEAARARAELEAAKAEAEAKARALAEAKAAQEAEAARLKAQQEAEAKARQELEAARLKAQHEAEAARLKAEQEAAKARKEAERAKQQAAAEAQARAEAARRAKEEAEAVRLKAVQEAEAARLKAEAERAKQQALAEAQAREEAVRRAKEEAEAARVKAEQEAAQARAELEAAKAKAEAEEKARQAAETAILKAQQEAELAKQQAHAEAERIAKEEAEAARVKAEQQAAKAREEAEQRARQEAETASLKAQQEAVLLHSAQVAAQARVAAEPVKARADSRAKARTTSATVLFFDVVGYTKQPVNKQIEVKKQFNQLVSDCLKVYEDSDLIILDTGDGAAIGFMQHPEDALEVAMQFRKTVMANEHMDFPDLKVRIGIHLGPINVVKDMNGRGNMVGDGINDAQRVMSFAGTDQIYISRSYYDFVSRLSDEYAELFKYRGAQKDKHGREHPVYELVDAVAPVVEAVQPQTTQAGPAMKLEPFNFGALGVATPAAPAVVHEEHEGEPDHKDIATQLLRDTVGIEPAEVVPPVAEKPQQPAATATATSKPPESKPEKEQAKPAAEARVPSEAEAKKLADTQAKAWAEAEQRAVEAAKANAERAAQQAAQPRAETSRVAKEKTAERASRKPIPWGMAGAGLFAVVLVALFAVPYVLPMQGYAPKIAQVLGSNLKQPVQVGHVAGRLLPTPRLELTDVSVGELKQIQAQHAQVNFAFSALFSSTKAINSLELDGVQVNGAALQQVSAWMQQVAADTGYPVAHIKLSQGKLEADGISITGVSGELSYGQAGKFTQAKLQADGGKFALDLNATPENKLQVAITVRGTALPLLPDWPFDELNAKGELSGDELAITDIDSRIMGGMLLGDARINWRSGWSAQGSLVAKTITMQNVNKLIAGDMDGSAHFQMQAASLAKLTDAAVMDGSFVIKKGIINGMDIVETARLRSRENLPGGRTHFDELNGELSYANNAYHFRQMKMSAGVLNATGTLDVAKQQLSGKVSADLSMRTAMGIVALQVGGNTDSPTLRVGR